MGTLKTLFCGGLSNAKNVHNVDSLCVFSELVDVPIEIVFQFEEWVQKNMIEM